MDHKFEIGDRVVIARALDEADRGAVGRTGVVVNRFRFEPEPDTAPAYTVRMDHAEDWDDDWEVAEWCLEKAKQ